MARRRILLTTAILFFVFIMITGFAVSFHIKNQVKDLFKLNKTLQEEGYYMAEFEFRMLGFAYTLDKGYYLKSLRMLLDYHDKLKNKEGLIKVPVFKNNQEEIDFFLNLQNPNTGAFIDETAPYCVYYEVSRNIIDHLVSLKDPSTGPLKLKYPLKFLDEINTPETLTAFLNDISYVGRLASKFPQTTFHFARNILSETKPDNSLETYGFYSFSPKWKHAMLKWMYDFQDAESGMWGPKNKRNGKIWKYDLNNTASILKNYRDNEGNNLNEKFPLRYSDKLFTTAINELSEPFPDEDDLDEIHEWNLRQAKGIAMLLRYLWKDATDENKKNAERIIKRNIDICFEKYYVENDGAFSYYPYAKKASCDGNTNIIYEKIGAFSYAKQKKLWGDSGKNMKNMGEVALSTINPVDIESIAKMTNINSFRVYTEKPDYKKLTDYVWALYYPRVTKVLDIMELVPNIVNWSETSTLSMGNWTSMAELKNYYSNLHIEKPLVFKERLPINQINNELLSSSEIYIIGFDKLQIPRYQIAFYHSNEKEKDK